MLVSVPDKRKKPVGINNTSQAINTLRKDINRQITPELDVDIDSQETQGKSVIRILVPYGEDRPYAIDDNRIYLRDENETSLAVRDEIVNLVQQGLLFQSQSQSQSNPTQISSQIKHLKTNIHLMTLPPPVVVSKSSMSNNVITRLTTPCTTYATAIMSAM